MGGAVFRSGDDAAWGIVGQSSRDSHTRAGRQQLRAEALVASRLRKDDAMATHAWRDSVGAEQVQALLAWCPELRAVERELVPVPDVGGLTFECRSSPDTVSKLAHAISVNAMAASWLVDDRIDKPEP